MSAAPGARCGVTLVELLVAVVLAGVVAAALCRVLQANQRFYRSQSEVLDVHQGVRAVAYVLATELRGLDARDGDLVSAGRDSVTIRAQRGFAVVCAPPDQVDGSVIVADGLTFGTRAVDPARDRALLFVDGGADSADAWLDFAVVAVSPGARCEDGSPGTSLRLSVAVGALARVAAGAPVRTYQRTTYRLYTDEDGLAWLGERHLVGGAWSAISPVAGPLRPGDGLALVLRDSSGAVTGEPPAAASVDLAIRGLSTVPIALPGRRATGQRYPDSLSVRVALRNN